MPANPSNRFRGEKRSVYDQAFSALRNQSYNQLEQKSSCEAQTTI